jgi:hypothetical protein
VGEIIFFARRENRLVVCELVHAPTSHTNSHVLPRTDSKHVTFPRELTALTSSQG